MRAIMKVETKAEFDAWMKEQADLQHPKAAPAAPAAPAAAPAAK
jgi:heme/copper-type cytochrome/quinol oxidase subunit 2